MIGMDTARKIKRDITKIIITIDCYSALSGNVSPYVQRICSNKTDNEGCALSTLKPLLGNGARSLHSVLNRYLDLYPTCVLDLRYSQVGAWWPFMP